MNKSAAEDPTPAMLLAMSDFGPLDESAASVVKCKKKMDRRRRNLGSVNVVLIGIAVERETARQRALLSVNEFCKRCGLCR